MMYLKHVKVGLKYPIATRTYYAGGETSNHDPETMIRVES